MPEIAPRQLTTLKNAKAAKAFIEKNTSDYDLIVVPYFDLVLRYYVEEIIARKMLNIIQSGKLEKIIYLGSSETPPHEFPSVGGISRTNFMKNHSFKLIQKFDTLSIYDLGLSIRKFPHPNATGDYENKTQFNYGKSTKVEHIDQPIIEGSKALKITTQPNHVSTLRSQKIESVNVSKDNSYILTSFARGYEELSQAALLHPINKNPPGIILLNIFSGIFASHNFNFVWKRVDPYKDIYIRPEEDDFTWELVFTIYPVPKGNLTFKTGLRSQSPVGHFDGFQSFILESKDTNN